MQSTVLTNKWIKQWLNRKRGDQHAINCDKSQVVVNNKISHDKLRGFPWKQMKHRIDYISFRYFYIICIFIYEFIWRIYKIGCSYNLDVVFCPFYSVYLSILYRYNYGWFFILSILNKFTYGIMCYKNQLCPSNC